MDGTARCLTCFRVEEWRGGALVGVPQPGGGRRAPVDANLAAWRTLRRVRAGELGPPVGKCPACEQPMFADRGATLAPVGRWAIAMPDAPVWVGPDGRVLDGDDDDADKRIEAHYEAIKPKVTAGEVGFGLVLLATVATLGAFLGVCECPSMAIAALIPAAAGARSRR